MEKIGGLFGRHKFPVKQPRRSERGDLLDWFLAELNPQRKTAGYGPLNHKRLAMMLQGIPTKDLYALQAKMKDATIPSSAVFHYEIRPRKDLSPS